MNQRPVIRYQVEVETLTGSLKVFSRLTVLATLAAIPLLGSFFPSLGFADMFQHSIHARCGNEASLLKFWIPSSDSALSGNRASSRSCSQAVHDVAVTDLRAPATGTLGDLLRVNVTVANYGSLAETVVVQLLANQTRILAVESLSVRPFSTSIVDIIWNTSGFAASTYALSGLALPVQGETNLANNSFGPVMVRLTEPSTGPTPSSGLPRFGLATEATIFVSLGEALLGLYIIGRRISGKPRKPVTKTKR